jgi:histone-lysine N-methyltransferase SETMAR
MQWKYPSSPSTKKFNVTPTAGKVMLTVFWNSQGVLSVRFQKRGENMYSASYCEVLLKLSDAIRRKHPCQLERTYTARVTQERIQELQWELLEHPPYSPELAHNDSHLFSPLIIHLGGKCSSDDEEVETEVRK